MKSDAELLNDFVRDHLPAPRLIDAAAATVLKQHPRPWTVYSAPLRHNSPTMIIEVQDANGDPVIPWKGFDDTGDSSYKQRIGIARLFVTLVNSAV